MSSFSGHPILKRSTKKGESCFNYPHKKRKIMSSSVLSDSGCSSSMSPSTMSGNDSSTNLSAKKKAKSFPTLALLTNPDEVIMNGRSRKRFPDPVHDRSVLLACYDSNQAMIKIRHGMRCAKTRFFESIMKTRIDMEPVNDDFFISDESCSHFLCLDSIQVHDSDGLKRDLANNIMMADIRDHSVAGKCLPDEITGYWVRMFGPKRKYSLYFSVWKNMVQDYKEASHNENHKTSLSNKMIKICEKCVVVWNSGREGKMKKRKTKKKKVLGITKALKEHELYGSDHIPSFCSREKYFQILSSLRESIENAKYDTFEEMYEQFSFGLTNSENRDDVELKLFLWCEKSQFFAIQGNYPEAKKCLQKVVDNVVPRSPNKMFMLNRAYLLLANTHVMEGNNGTAEECLSVIQPDKKNGMPYEDICLFDLLRGIILMNFGKQLPRLSNFLWAESKESFEASEVNFKKTLPLMFNQYCRMHLNLGRLLMYQCLADGSKLNFDAPKKRIYVLESYGVDKLSLHVRCLLSIVKSELLYHLKQEEKGSILLVEAQEMAEKNQFHAECILSDQIKQSWNEIQYQQFLDSLESEKLSEAVRNCVMSDVYSADQSST